MRVILCTYLVLLPLLARAQITDEPGVGGRPVAPPLARPAPPTSAPVGRSDPGVLQRARTQCRPGASCPHFPGLVELLFTSGHGVSAGLVLADLGEARAVLPLALAAVYGPAANRTAVLDALRTLVNRPSARPVARRVSRADADPAVRGVVTRALGGEAARRAEPALDTELVELKAAKQRALGDPDTTRVVYGPTAFGRPKGVWNWTIYNIGYWSFDYGVTDHLEIGMQTVPPIGIVAFMPNAKLSFSLGEKVALGLRAFGGVLYPYIGNDTAFRIGIYGGGPILSIGSPDLLLNLSVNVTGITVANREEYGAQQDETVHNTVWAVTPNLGFGWRLSRRVKLNAELFLPLTENNPVSNGKLWVLLYGIRIFSRRIYGDVSFVIPFWPDMGEVMKYLPIGFPLLSFGFQWGAV